ncbi:MAG: chloride channel protein [Firmicutes bacterium]|nr:chloride channel protein [Bacillota bacterium]
MIGAWLGGGINKLPGIRSLFSKDSRLLVLCSASAMLGAAFGSPVGAGLFVIETVSALQYQEVLPTLASSIIGSLVYGEMQTGGALLNIPYYEPRINDLPYIISAAAVSALLSLVFIKVYSFSENGFQKIRQVRLRLILGGILTSTVLMLAPSAGGIGLDFIQDLLQGRVISIGMLLFLPFAKTLATSSTVGSGQSGGLVVPALFLGSLAGTLVNRLVGLRFTAPLIIAGMGAALAGIAKVPLAASVILLELGGSAFAAPAVIGSVIGYLVTYRDE